MGGEWRIVQQPPAPGGDGGYRVEIIPIADRGPEVDLAKNGIVFRHTDGRTTIYPWTQIVRAEYVPHNDDQ